MVKEFECINNKYISNYEDCPAFANRYKLNRYFKRVYSHSHLRETQDSLYIFPQINDVPDKFVDNSVKKIIRVDVEFRSRFISKNLNTILDGVEKLTFIPAPIEIRAKTPEGIEFPVIKYFPARNLGFALDLSHDMSQWGDHIEDLDRIMKSFISLLESKSKSKKESNIYVTIKGPLTMGADTEIEMVKDHRIVPAHDALSDMGYDWDNYPDLFETRYGTIGVDLSDAQIELRPDYSEDPLELLENHYVLLEELRKEGIYYNINTLRYPCGMHIHFGPSTLAEHISQWFAPLTEIASILNRNPIPQQKRRLEDSFRYGMEGDFRKQSWGIEYRAFPSVILAIPDIAEKFFVGIYNIMREFTKKGHIKVNYEFWENLIEELREKVDKPYLFADLPQVENSIVGKEFAGWLEQKMLEELEAPYPYVSFYSLRRERGMATAGLKTSLTEEIKHPSENTTRKVFRFGIPYEWKKTGIPKEVWNDILKAVVKKTESPVTTTKTEAVLSM